MNEQHLNSLLARGGDPMARRTWNCPDDSRLAAYADGRLDAETREGLAKHLAGCDFCLGQIAFLAGRPDSRMPADVPPGLLARARQLAEPSPPQRIWAVPAWRWGAVAAVTACLAVGTTFWMRTETPLPGPAPAVAPTSPAPPAPALQAPVAPAPSPGAAVGASRVPAPVRGRAAPVSSPQIISPREGAVLRAGDVKLRWKRVPGSVFYEARVVSAEGDLIWEGRAEGTQVQVPAGTPFASGANYFVWVRAYLPDGKTIESKALGFRIE